MVGSNYLQLVNNFCLLLKSIFRLQKEELLLDQGNFRLGRNVFRQLLTSLLHFALLAYDSA